MWYLTIGMSQWKTHGIHWDYLHPNAFSTFKQKMYDKHWDTNCPNGFGAFSVGTSHWSGTMHLPMQKIKYTIIHYVIYSALLSLPVICFLLICLVRDPLVAKVLAQCSQMYLSSSSSAILLGL